MLVWGGKDITMNINLKNIAHKTQFCVVGGGLAGICAAVAAARRGVKVVLMHDRPVLGGNASSEIRMWVCGAYGRNNRETGIIEEIALENCYRNPYRTYPIWDSILFDLVKRERNLTLLLNCSCNDIEMDGNRIYKIYGWQGTSQLWHSVEADYFADCSGDSILAPLSGAEYRCGRECRAEFGEAFGPETADRKTMGNSCLIQAREMPQKRDFIPPEQTRRFTREQLKCREPNMNDPAENYWYMELGGQQDTVQEAEEIRDELIRVAYGIWDYVKNSGNCNADNWELDFVGYLPGKRENRRYVGDYIMTANDVQAGGRFDDVIAYGGWTMDDHDPAGIDTTEPPTTHYQAPSPFGIPYRCVYSRNIDNLFFAGRNISVSHGALSATRVMATCALLGQAVGTAAAIAAAENCTPRQVYQYHIEQLQQELMEDDCYLPFRERKLSELARTAEIFTTGSHAEKLLNGLERPDAESDNMWVGKVGDSIVFRFPRNHYLEEMRFVYDSDLNRETISEGQYLNEKMTICNVPLNYEPICVPKTLVRSMKAEIFTDGAWREIPGIANNHKRLVKLPVQRICKGVRITLLDTWGNETVGIHSIDFKELII